MTRHLLHCHSCERSDGLPFREKKKKKKKKEFLDLFINYQPLKEHAEPQILNAFYCTASKQSLNWNVVTSRTCEKWSAGQTRVDVTSKLPRHTGPHLDSYNACSNCLFSVYTQQIQSK